MTKTRSIHAGHADAARRARWTLVPSLMALWMCVAPHTAAAQSREAVLYWHRVAVVAQSTPGSLPPTIFPARPYALVSVAVFDAANTFDLTYRPYATRVNAPAGASRDAAVAQAAHDVLVAMYPSLRQTIDDALATVMTGIAPEAARAGAAVGAKVAAATLELRSGDGWSRTPPVLELPSLPGYWTPTPPGNAAATFTHYPDVTGFVVPNGRHFLMEGPPSLTGARYAADFNETKAIGAVESTTRTAEQTQVARLFAGVGTSTNVFAVWHGVVASLVERHGLSGVDTARLFALANIATHDGFMTSFTGKFLYGFWRPVTAIRQADTDGNEATVADPAWTPLLVTPPYPGHPGNMACHGATQARVLERTFGEGPLSVQVTWTVPNAPAVIRSYGRVRDLADESARSRIYGGIHFAFESAASIGACNALADYAVDNYLRRP